MKEIRHILDIQLADNVKAQILQPDGTYVKIDKRGKNLVCAQEYFCEEAVERAKEQMPAEVHSERVFVPSRTDGLSERKINNGAPYLKIRIFGYGAYFFAITAPSVLSH